MDAPVTYDDSEHGTGRYDDSEQYEIIARMTQKLWGVIKDGGRKRAAGSKPNWKVDPSHEGAIFSHLAKWQKGELVDPDSGEHPLVHLAARALMQEHQETTGPKAQQVIPHSLLDFGAVEDATEAVDTSGVVYINHDGKWTRKQSEHCHAHGYGGMELCSPGDVTKYHSCKNAGVCVNKKTAGLGKVARATEAYEAGLASHGHSKSYYDKPRVNEKSGPKVCEYTGCDCGGEKHPWVL